MPGQEHNATHRRLGWAGCPNPMGRTWSSVDSGKVKNMNRVAIGCAVALGLVLGGAGTAYAGETNGNGDPIPGAENANSACAFSGQDLPDEIEGNPLPEFNDDFVTDGHVQSYGRFVSHDLKDVVPSPGDACRGGVEFGG